MKKLSFVAVVVVASTGCGSGGDAQTAADTLTRAQKDSIVADLPIPGAGGVGAAMQARDRLNQRTEMHDTIG